MLYASQQGDHVYGNGEAGTPPALTDRQRRILLLICEGATDRRIAGRVLASERTVQREIAEIRTILGAASRTQIVAAAARHGLLFGKSLKM
ncbi:helix-turn-helix transcriptional regulator [Actinoplanes sp. NPDC049802]|uniref:helix-turn-helix transcriptional regulator n=1 Tax=Actinoplanes sp. NPDC049802 TaxID=3154742 RepID=UPI0033EED958